MATVSTERVITDGIEAITPAQAIRYLDQHNGGKLTAADKSEIVNAVWSIGTNWKVRPGRAFAQMCHETADFTFPNQVSITKRNPAGIGATNDGAPGLQYPSWSAGIMGYYVHLAAWLGGPVVVPQSAQFYTTQVDPRVHIVEQVRATVGPVVTWADLGGRWAVPGIGYGAAIDRKYAAILATTRGTTMQLFAETASQLTPGSNTPGGRLLGFDAFVVHETDNENIGAGVLNTYNYLMGTYNNKIRPQASFHFCTDGISGGHSFQFLPAGPQDAVPCWAIGDGQDETDDASNRTVSGEICVNKDGNYNVAVAKMARIVAKVLKAHGKQPIKDQTIRQHGSYWSARNPAVHQGCPKHLKAGDWGTPRINWDTFCSMVTAEYNALAGTGEKVITNPQVGTDPISKALTDWYKSNSPAVQGDLSPNSYRECDVNFSGLYPTIQGWQRAIRGEFIMAWYHPDGAISCVHPADKIAIETNPAWFRLR